MLLLVLFAMVFLLTIFAILAVSLAVSKAVNGFFFGIFGNAYVVVKLLCWLKKIFLIGIIFKLIKGEKAKKAKAD